MQAEILCYAVLPDDRENKKLLVVINSFYSIFLFIFAQSAGAVEYANCTYAKG